MPNNITNVISIENDDHVHSRFRRILEYVRADESFLGSVDFNKLIPMPDAVYKGNLGQAERQLYGKNNWYDWSLANWGTKWNAYDCISTSPEDGCLESFTAWDYVPDIIKKQSKVFPEAEIRYQWADEDIGMNVGEVTLKNAEVIDENIPQNGSRKAYELAAEIMQVDLADYNLYLNKDGSNYEYRKATVELAKPDPAKSSKKKKMEPPR